MDGEAKMAGLFADRRVDRAGQHLRLIDGADRRDKESLQPRCDAAIQSREHGFADDREAIEPAERFDHHIGSHDVLLQVVEKGVPGVDQLRSGFMSVNDVIKITARNFAHLIASPHDHRKLFSLMVLAPRAIPDKHAEEPAEAVRLVGAGGLEMTAKRFGAHVDTEDRLRLRPHRRQALF